LYYSATNFKIKPTASIREKVYEHLKQQILNNQIPADAILVETHLARQIGISRTPIREALHFLEKEGLLEVLPRAGYRVRQIDWQEVEEVVEIRKEIEALAARWAAERIEPEEIEALKANLAQSRTMIKQGDLELFPELDAQFHEIISRASRSSRLVKLIQSLRSDMLRYRVRSLYRKDISSLALAGHRRIFECLAGRDPKGVQSAVHKHLDDAKENIRHYAFHDKAIPEPLSTASSSRDSNSRIGTRR
jgi:DNA-binding GntR family transcriptional regulator